MGDIIVFTDDDCEPLPNWLTQMLKPFADPDVVGAKGVYRSRQREIIARFVQIEYEDRYRLMARQATIDFIDTYSAAFRGKRFLELNGYDTSFPVACAEDVELSYRMSARGWKMVFMPTAVVYHQHPNAFTGYVRKKFKFAFWRVLALKKNPEKVLRDSHTPQLMKLQMLFAPALPVCLLCDFLRPSSMSLCGIVMLLFLLTALPFSLCAFSRDPLVGALAPCILAARSCSQFLGVVFGGAYAFAGSAADLFAPVTEKISNHNRETVLWLRSDPAWYLEASRFELQVSLNTVAVTRISLFGTVICTLCCVFFVRWRCFGDTRRKPAMRLPLSCQLTLALPLCDQSQETRRSWVAFCLSRPVSSWMMLREQAKTINGISRAADCAAIAVSFAGAATICEPLNHVQPLAWVPGFGGPDASGASSQYALLFFVSLMTWLAVAQLRGTYLFHRTKRYELVLRDHVTTQTLWVISTGFCVFVFKFVLISPCVLSRVPAIEYAAATHKINLWPISDLVVQDKGLQSTRRRGPGRSGASGTIL